MSERDPPPRRILVTGATGATGTCLRQDLGLDLGRFLFHQRPRPDRSPPPGWACFSLSEGDRLRGLLADEGVTTVVQLIGTMRRRFKRGDTYATSDVGTTAALASAARRVATVDHFVLLSSVGAGRPVGAYLRAKAEAERWVTESGVPWTILRPSAFVGGGHRPPPGAAFVTRSLGLRRWQPIALADLAAVIAYAALHRAWPEQVLEGEALWQAVEQSRAWRYRGH